jgi:hypothetical protein
MWYITNDDDGRANFELKIMRREAPHLDRVEELRRIVPFFVIINGMVD